MRYLILLVLLLGLVSCGGGDSSTENSEEATVEETKTADTSTTNTPVASTTTKPATSTTTAPKTAAVQNGTYRGTQNITLTLDGVSASTGNVALTINVSNGRVSLLGTSGSLSSGNKFDIPVIFSYSENGLTCYYSMRYAGTFASNKATGSITGTAICGVDIIAMKGSFSTSSFAKGRSLFSSNIESKLIGAASKLIK